MLYQSLDKNSFHTPETLKNFGGKLWGFINGYQKSVKQQAGRELCYVKNDSQYDLFIIIHSIKSSVLKQNYLWEELGRGASVQVFIFSVKFECQPKTLMVL